MSEYDDVVQKQREILDAEKWAKGVRSLHAHSLSSMWYDNRPQDTENSKRVTDIQYNSGLVVRKTDDGQIIFFGEQKKGQELLESFHRHQ
jgi:hypothetical protein